MATTVSSRDWRVAKERVLESALRCDWRDEEVDRDVITRSQYGRLIRAIADAAAEHAASAGDPPEETEFEYLVGQGVDVVRDLRGAFGRFEKEEGRLLVWRHLDDASELIVSDRSPAMDREMVEGATQTYLDLPYRVPALDRLLVDALVALELFAFGDEMVGNKAMLRGGPAPLKMKPVRSFLLGHAGNLVAAMVIGALAYGASQIHLFPAGWLPGLFVLLGLAFLGFLALGIVTFPKHWLAVSKARKKAIDLMSAMNGVYAELRSDGPISTRHIHQRAQSVAADGVIWPAPLFVLLDDINARTGRI